MNKLAPPTQMVQSSLRVWRVWLTLVVASGCTFHDYEYLGAARGLMSQDGGQAGRAGVNIGGNSRAGAVATVLRSGGASSNETGGRTLTDSLQSGGGVTGLGGTRTAISSGASDGLGGLTFGGARSVGGSATDNPIGGGTTLPPATGGNTSGGATRSVATGGSVNSTGTRASGGNATGGSQTGGTSAVVGGTSGATGGTSAASSANGGTDSCAGCARLEVPFTAAGQRARYYLKFLPWATVNAYSGSTMTLAGKMKIRARARALGNTQYQMLIQQDSGDYVMCFSAITSVPPEITTSWVTLEWALGTCASDSSIGRLGFDLITSSSEVAPSKTSMLIDSIWIELHGKVIVGPFNFDVASSINASAVANDWAQTNGVLYLRPSTVAPASTPPTGSTIAWEGSSG